MLATIAAASAAVMFAPLEEADHRGGLPAVAAVIVLNVVGLWAIRRGYVRAIGLA
jgi:hypothetical protein